MGGAPSVQAQQAPDTGQEYSSAIQAYLQNAGALYGTEAQYAPQYNALQRQMEQQNIGAYAQQYFGLMPQAQAAQNAATASAQQSQLAQMQQMAPSAAQALMGQSPQWNQLANYASQQMGAGPNEVLTGVAQQLAGAAPQMAAPLYNLAAQAGQQIQPINQQLGALSNQALVGAGQQAAQLGTLQQQVLQNARSDIFNQTKANVMGALGQLDPLTQQLQTSAQQQLALGGQMSPQMAASVAQQERAAYQSRGLLQSTGSIGAEIMGQQQVQQQLLGQREAFAGSVAPLVQSETQQRVANAMGLTSTDIQATLANQQLGGQLGQAISGIQQGAISQAGGLQAQIGQNLQNLVGQQAGLYGQAGQAYTGALQAAGGIYETALQQQLAQQQQGAAAAQYLTGAQQANLQNLMGYAGTGANIAAAGAGLNQYGTGGPSLFQSSGLLNLVAQNQAMQYNAQMAAQQMNAQSKGAATGAMIGAGGAILGAAAGGLALF
jgi:hypothetical protein